MTEEKKRRRNQQTYRPHVNAVCLTIYDMHGKAIPADVRKQAEQAITDIALANNLLIGIATV